MRPNRRWILSKEMIPMKLFLIALLLATTLLLTGCVEEINDSSQGNTAIVSGGVSGQVTAYPVCRDSVVCYSTSSYAISCIRDKELVKNYCLEVLK